MSVYEIISLIINILIMIAGFSAITIYKLQQNDKIKTAATLIVTQINFIETNIKLMKDAEQVDEVFLFKLKRILEHNYWSENRHLLSKKLGTSNICIIEDFYSQVEEIEKSREIICNEMIKTWENKEFVYQLNLAKEIMNNNDFNIEKSRLPVFEKYGTAYSAKLPKDHLYKTLNNFNYISGTVAYDLLRKISYHA